MKYSEFGNIKRLAKENFLATTGLSGALQEVNDNVGWKNKSSKLVKTKMINIKHQNKYSNIMTEEDLDRLFHKSKEKENQLKIKTEAAHNHLQAHNQTQGYRKGQSPPFKQSFKDFASSVKFLRVEDQNDKLLTGLPHRYTDHIDQNKIDQLFHDDHTDLTAKFKKDYMVGKVIGQGAYASVRVALYRPDNMKIAIKAYEKNKIKESQRKKSVRRQIKILQMLDHPNIVKIYDVVETNNHLNIIMEYLPGISLSTCLKSQPHQKFTQSHCKIIIKSLANALKYLHERHISHRDIKLQNIILNEEYSPKLIDFGFSTCIEPHKKIKIFCGTPSYMAPQIVQKKEYRGECADIWALGVLFFVLITGNFPYKGLTDQDLYKKINNAEYPKTQISNLKDINHLINRMFAINPDQRITASEILAHPWITGPKYADQFKKQKSKESADHRYKNISIGRSKQSKQQSPPIAKSKKKKIIDTGNQKMLLKTSKQLSSKLNYTYGRSNLGKTLASALRQEGNHTINSIKSNKKQNLRILDLLKIEIKKKKEDKSKCKSHRI